MYLTPLSSRRKKKKVAADCHEYDERCVLCHRIGRSDVLGGLICMFGFHK